MKTPYSLFLKTTCLAVLVVLLLHRPLIAGALRTPVDTVQIQSVLDRAQVLLGQTQYGSATNSAEKAFNQSVEADWVPGKAQGYYLLGKISQGQKNGTHALQYFMHALYEYEKLGSTDIIGTLKFDIATVYSKQSMHEKALSNFKSAYKHALTASMRAKCNERIAFSFLGLNKPDSAILYYEKSFGYFASQGDTANMLVSLKKAVDVETQNRRYPKALERYLQIHMIFLEQKDSLNIVTSLNNIGFLVKSMGEDQKSLSYYHDALRYGQNPEQLASIHTNIAVTQQHIGRQDKAIRSLKKALTLRETLKDTSRIAATQNMVAQVYLNGENYHDAGIFATKAAKLALDSKDNAKLAQSYLLLSEVYNGLGDYKNALTYYQQYSKLKDKIELLARDEEQTKIRRYYQLEKYEKHVQLSIAENEIKDLAMNSLMLEAEKKEHDLQLLKREKELQSITFSKQELEREAKMNELLLSQKYLETERKDKAIILLNQDKRIKEIALKKRELEKKEQEKIIQLLEKEKHLNQLEIKADKNRRIYFTVSGIGALITIIIIIISYYKVCKGNRALTTANHKVQQRSEEISVQNQIIATKNKEIVDSINYASRIQSAILPENILQSCLPKHFILYKPRDIVSGDFYWMKDMGKCITIAVADCTGHGVPGAFMSMLGTAFLNEIANRLNAKRPGQILDELRLKVKHVLNHNGDGKETKDGMDIAIYTINKVNMELYFSGAYNPLYIIRKRDNANDILETDGITVTKNETHNLIILKGDRQPIGVFIKERPFKTKTIMLKKGDLLYSFSDGYPDQLGGELGRKFLSKNFKKLLLKIAEKPMPEQLSVLNTTFEKWRGNGAQVDDVLIIGVKL